METVNYICGKQVWKQCVPAGKNHGMIQQPWKSIPRSPTAQQLLDEQP